MVSGGEEERRRIMIQCVKGKYLKKIFGLLRREKNGTKKEENDLGKENVTMCDRQTRRQNCEHKARILDSEFAIFFSSVRRSVESSNPQIIQERYPPNRSLPSLQLSPQLLN